MTNAEIVRRLRRTHAALGDVSGTLPENAPLPEIKGVGANFELIQDYSAGRTPEQFEKDAFSVINEIMGLKDRARSWIKAGGGNPDEVEAFLKSHRNAAIVHDLANADKHGKLGRETVSGIQVELSDVCSAVVLTRDPLTGKYASTGSVVQKFNIDTGEVEHMPSENTEIVLTGDVRDEKGNEVTSLHDLLFWAIREWEDFLVSKGLVLS